MEPFDSLVDLIHWRVSVDKDHIVWLYLDRHGASINSINKEVLVELETILLSLHNNKNQKLIAVVIASGKKSGFIAGADVSQFETLTDERAAFDLIRQAQMTLDRLASLPIPSIALIRGFCLGGGCELALACTYRIAENIPATRIGLPEVKLGIHPGWGGTVRLPALIGGPTALRMMLSGEICTATKAAKIGLVDVAVSSSAFLNAARSYALRVHARRSPPRGCLTGMSNWFGIRLIIGNLILRKLAQRVRSDHYPAPFAIVRNWMKEGTGPHAYLTEAKSIAKLLVSPTSRHLVRLFFLQNRLKAIAKSSECRHVTLQHVHVVGAGTMGGDIAAWCAYKGLSVTLQDQNATRIAPAIKRAVSLYQKKLRSPHLVQAVLDRLQPDVAGTGVAKADLVIEAISEDLTVKQHLYQQLEPQLQSHAILATNTSSIALDKLNSVLKNPDRFVGIHFFNPVAKMELVEIVYGEKTRMDIIQHAAAWVGSIGRLPVLVKAKPGFLVNRLLMPYLLEAVMIYEEGVPVEMIDRIARDFGMPMGPLMLADTVGLDICLSVAQVLAPCYGITIPPVLEEFVRTGKLGRKSGGGFYQAKVSHRPAKPDYDVKDIQDRMIFRLLNEAFCCLEEKIIEDADLLDAAMVFGTGFAPFRGGPIRYAQELGRQSVTERFEYLARQYGERFIPTQWSGWS